MRSPTRGTLPLFDPPFPPVAFPESMFLLVPVWKVLRPLVKSTRSWEEAETERRGQRRLEVAPERLLIAETFHMTVLFCDARGSFSVIQVQSTPHRPLLGRMRGEGDEGGKEWEG